MVRTLLLASAVLAAAPQPACVPSHPVAEGVPAGDSVTIAGTRVARTARAVRRAHLGDRVRLDGPQFYAGERVVFTLDGVRLGTTIFDGCRFVPESPGFAANLVASALAQAVVLPVDTAGYQTLAFRTADATRAHP